MPALPDCNAVPDIRSFEPRAARSRDACQTPWLLPESRIEYQPVLESCSNNMQTDSRGARTASGRSTWIIKQENAP